MKLNKKHTLNYVIGGVMLLALGLAVNKWLKGMKQPALDINNNEVFLDTSLVLSKGMEEPEVTELQTILKNKYKANLGTYGDNKDGVDGIFGTITETALVKAKGVKTIALKDL
jgi:peptidoglycan hydrolase-like protein with peptidoglycan-binding domain